MYYSDGNVDFNMKVCLVYLQKNPLKTWKKDYDWKLSSGNHRCVVPRVWEKAGLELWNA